MKQKENQEFIENAKNNLNKNESGKSMVEMLGVLALSGILVSGGILGYHYAIDKMNANNIINEIHKRALTISQQRMLQNGINLKEYHPTSDVDLIQNKYEVLAENDYNGYENFFSLTTLNIPKGVCNQILNLNWSLPSNIKIGQNFVDEQTTCSGDINDMCFIFNDKMNNSVSIDPACYNITCPDTKICSEGKCVCKPQTTICGPNCCPAGYKCLGGYIGNWCREICLTDADCPQNQYCSKGGACGECLQNEHCNPDSFCATKGSKKSGVWGGPGYAIGECQPLDYQIIEVDGNLFYLSNNQWSLYESNDFCSALGAYLQKSLHLINWQDLGYTSTPAYGDIIPLPTLSSLMEKNKPFWVDDGNCLQKATCGFVDKNGARHTSYYTENQRYTICR